MTSRGPSAGESWIGLPLRRREDRRFLQGLARYVDDLALPGMLYMTLLRSPVAHASLQGVEAAAARRLPGVLAVVTAADLEGQVHPLPVITPAGASAAPVSHPLLARQRVRYVGEPIAAVLAESREAAADAVDALVVEYDPLPPLPDPHSALEGGVLLHEAAPGNVLLRWKGGSGDVAGAFRAAAHVVRGAFRLPRLAAAPIEPRGAVAAYDPRRDLLTVWGSSQDPYRPRSQLSHVLGRPEERIRYIVPDVGGAFGSKGALAPEAALAAFLAIRWGRPVKWVEGRREDFAAAYQGRGMEAEAELAAGAAGHFLGLRARLVADLGAYLHPLTPLPPVTACMLLSGVYAIPNVEVELLGVATTKVPTGPYRGAGRPEAAFIIERMVDLAAQQLCMDPVELRRRNLIPPHRFPYPNGLGYTYDSGDYRGALDRVCVLAGYAHRREEQRRAREEGRLLGIGVAMYVERAGDALAEHARIAVRPDGHVVVHPGSTAHGQGHQTAFAQIVADLLGVDPSAVAVRQGDSAHLPHGGGTFASRSVTVGGSAVFVAVQRLRERAARIAAHLLEAAPQDIVWADGAFSVRGSPGRAVTFAEVAAAAYRPDRLPAGLDPGLEASGEFTLPGPVFPYGACVAVVEVDTQTGLVQVRQIVAVDDPGRVINPLLAEGQITGAAVQGLGQALREQVVYDESGQLLSATFLDYGLLRAPDVPPIAGEFQETPSPFNPLGAKGIGEAGAIGTPAAVANAVMDALQPLGVRHLDLPLTPEKVWRAIRDAQTPGSDAPVSSASPSGI
ncbi:MAG: xanthine dehydrogenase family protein molybdopterin-binding subunit [Armatimonadota bacterium]|nr:xanthine dehydrogenase family protein molybdopterin-binding subunit [Armatimonadota bacterium]MDR7426151.1 xanthine dehydrogenase family protein molybdopterin-binding subunit [Armatimonadota bacterium]MDR7465067.1 xanthine dehydrogenase family protein molybdopterin-binding subunit [Armatimonadota bacterium]